MAIAPPLIWHRGLVIFQARFRCWAAAPASDHTAWCPKQVWQPDGLEAPPRFGLEAYYAGRFFWSLDRTSHASTNVSLVTRSVTGGAGRIYEIVAVLTHGPGAAVTSYGREAIVSIQIVAVLTHGPGAAVTSYGREAISHKWWPLSPTVPGPLKHYAFKFAGSYLNTVPPPELTLRGN